jgi:hypothetical protein
LDDINPPKSNQSETKKTPTQIGKIKIVNVSKKESHEDDNKKGNQVMISRNIIKPAESAPTTALQGERISESRRNEELIKAE